MKIYDEGKHEVQWIDSKSVQPVTWYKVFKTNNIK
jgi:hypothetical protein